MVGKILEEVLMSHYKKLYLRIKNNPKNVRFGILINYSQELEDLKEGIKELVIIYIRIPILRKSMTM